MASAKALRQGWVRPVGGSCRARMAGGEWAWGQQGRRWCLRGGGRSCWAGPESRSRGTSEEAHLSEDGGLDQVGSRYFRKGASKERSSEYPALRHLPFRGRKKWGRQQIPLHFF